MEDAGLMVDVVVWEIGIERQCESRSRAGNGDVYARPASVRWQADAAEV